MKWELKELEDAVRDVHGDQYADAILEPLQSFSWKSDMANFHACEAEQILKEAIAATPRINNHDPPAISTAKAVMLAAAPGDAGASWGHPISFLSTQFLKIKKKLKITCFRGTESAVVFRQMF